MSDHERQKQPALSSSRSFLSRTLLRRDGGSISSEDVKGPLGLNTLYTPLKGSAIADLIFVHGLAGGSRSTWTSSGDPALYWPRNWLPYDEAFEDVRIHSFGYDSDWKKGSILGVQDFAKSLLGSIVDCPVIPRNTKAPLVFVGHSMGGLVIKRAYILAKQKEDYVSLADRVEAMFFLATPHRGSDLAPVFSKFLNLSGGARPFVTDLHRDSLAIQSINDEFPYCCQDLRLFSFYETLPTGYGVGTSIIVGRDLATLGYVNERSEYLNANHRGVCKYASQDDPNYRTVRNALASVTDVLRSRLALTKQEISNDQRRLLNSFLGVSDAPEDDFMSVDSLRTSGSCEWLIEKTSFQQWLHDATPPIYWISAKPATGKTILSGKIISHLRERHENCSFYFFHHGNKEKTSITLFLLSMAWQMALLNKEVLDTVLQICEKDDHLNKADYRTVWRKLFLEGILKLHFDHTQYWVVDALDECKTEPEVVSLLTKVVEVCSIRIFVTSRNRYDSCRRVGLPKVQVASERIQEEDSKSDIALYIEANVDELPSVGGKGRQHIVRQILEKSVGCFLWVSLVFQELRKVHTSTDVQKILDEVPTDMNELYARILDSMSTAAYGKSLAKAILTWTVCSTRPLKISELYDALRLDLKDSIGSIEGSIGSCCGQLVYVDAQSHVQMIHLTARDFLRNSTYSEFAVDEKDGHRRLLMTCLQYLNGDEMKGARRRKLSASNIPQERSSFVSYASNSLSEHITQVPSTDDDVVFTLARFFGSPNVLSWVEYIATYSDLNRLVQTGKALGQFLQGCSVQASKKDIALLNSWATDLVRLATKFGRNLVACPSSIFNLIPPFCPPTTAPRKQFCISACTITVSGLRAETWDDYISTIIDTREQYSSLASSETLFAIGTFSGKVMLYKQTTCQEVGILQHEEPVRLLKLGDVANILVSAGSRKIRIWDLASKVYIWDFDAPQQCMSLSLTDRDQLLLGCLKDHHLKIWDVNTGCLTEDVDWTHGLEGMAKQLYRRPITAAFSVDADLLAVIYKGQDILLWDLESDCLYDTYSRESGATANPGRPYGSAGVRCLVFGAGANANLLASAYGDGELVLFDTSTGLVKERTEAFAHILARSADGSALASADPSGTIQLFNFKTMRLLYRINSVEPGIRDLVFSGDGLRLLDIRGSHCQVWEPMVLVGQNAEGESKEMVTIPTTSQEIILEPYEDVVMISSMACHNSGEVFFCGKEDGSVYLYEVKSGVQARKLFTHAHGVTIVSLDFEEDSHTLSSIDNCGRIMIHTLTREVPSMVANEALFDHRVGIAVGQLVCGEGLHRILVCSAKSDMLWSLAPDGYVLLETICYEDRKGYRWARHPSNPDHLILITNNEAHIYEWQTLRKLTGTGGISLEGSILPELSIRSIAPCFNGTVLATTFIDSLRPRSKPKLVLWNTSDFAPGTKVAAPVPDSHHLADQIEILIGSTTTGAWQTERLIFLDESNWVCTADSPTTNAGQYVRHFFFPADWLSKNVELIIQVTKKGDIILVKRDEVAVVKRGLLTSEYVEVGSGMPGGRRRLLAPRTRKSTALAVPLS